MARHKFLHWHQLNTNENPYPPSPALVQAIAKLVAVARVSGSLNRYPDREAIDLRSALANFLNELSGPHLSAKQYLGGQWE